MSNQFFYFDPHIFGQISSILVIKQVLYNIFQSTIVTYNFCMIPHSLIFSFILVHFGRRQNPTGLQEAIQGLDKNSMTTLIIKSTLERLYLKKKHLKNHFWNFALFTRFNLQSYISNSQTQHPTSSHLECAATSKADTCHSDDPHIQPILVVIILGTRT